MYRALHKKLWLFVGSVTADRSDRIITEYVLHFSYSGSEESYVKNGDIDRKTNNNSNR